MRALTLIEPWASLVALGLKTVETRSWRPPESLIGDRIAIHASKSREAIEDGTASRLFHLAGLETPDSWPFGCIVAVAQIERVQRTEDARAIISSKEESFGNYSPGRFAWHFDGIVRLSKPLPTRGMLGLWIIELTHLSELQERLPV